MKSCSTCKSEKPDDAFTARRPQCKDCRNAVIYAWRAKNKEAVREAKRRYYRSEKGREGKRREEASLKASGKRAEIDARRAQKPVSKARLAARERWRQQNPEYYAALRAKRRVAEKIEPPAEIAWVLREARKLAKLREKLFGFAWHVDHIKPISKGGTNALDNLQVVPATWNRRKSNRTAERFFGAA